MKASKITFLLVAVIVLTVSVVSKDNAVQNETLNFKEYTPKKSIVIDKKKLKVVGQA